ncbi:hypothetical protein ACOMHN_024150 [Nucella lapillus]
MSTIATGQVSVAAGKLSAIVTAQLKSVWQEAQKLCPIVTAQVSVAGKLSPIVTAQVSVATGKLSPIVTAQVALVLEMFLNQDSEAKYLPKTPPDQGPDAHHLPTVLFPGLKPACPSATTRGNEVRGKRGAG